MNTRAALLVTALLALPSTAQDSPSGDTEAMMKAYMEAMAPVEQHAELAKLAGDWTTEETLWTFPGAPPQTATGSCTYTSILGGRYVAVVHTSNYGGLPYEGQGFIAYDKQAGEFVQTWVDNMNTAVMIYRGRETGDGIVEYSGENLDPISKKDVSYRVIFKLDSEDQHTFTLFKIDDDGGETKSMEIVYNRKK